MSSVTSVLEYLTIILAITGTIYKILIFIYNRYLKPIFVQINSIEQKIMKVSKEFQPNGGSSLRDIINKIDNRTIKTEERQKAILNDASYAVFEADSCGNFTYTNRAFSDWLSKSKEEIVHTNWINSIFIEDRADVEKEWYDCIAKSRNFSMQFRFVTRHNDVFSVHASAQSLKTNTGDVLGWFGIIQKFSDIQNMNSIFPTQIKIKQHFEE